MSELERYEKQFGKDAGYYRLKEKLDKIDKKYKLYKDMGIPVELQAKTIADNLYRNNKEYIRKIEKIILHCKVGSIKEWWYVRKISKIIFPNDKELRAKLERVIKEQRKDNGIFYSLKDLIEKVLEPKSM